MYDYFTYSAAIFCKITMLILTPIFIITTLCMLYEYHDDQKRRLLHHPPLKSYLMRPLIILVLVIGHASLSFALHPAIKTHQITNKYDGVVKNITVTENSYKYGSTYKQYSITISTKKGNVKLTETFDDAPIINIERQDRQQLIDSLAKNDHLIFNIEGFKVNHKVLNPRICDISVTKENLHISNTKNIKIEKLFK